jgi:hypothetical protein
VRSRFTRVSDHDFPVIVRDLNKGLFTGFSREPWSAGHTGRVLGDFVTVVRGIATGANAFFFITTEKAGT